MHIIPTKLHTNNHHPRHAGRPGRRRLPKAFPLAGMGALGLAAAFGTLGFTGPAAHASEFEAIPDAQIAAQCGPNGLTVTVTMTNSGNAVADFSVDTDIGGHKDSQAVQVFDQPVVASYLIFEDEHGSVDVVSKSGKGFSAHFEEDADCTDNVSGSVTLVCQTPQMGSHLEYTTWNHDISKAHTFVIALPDGSTKQFVKQPFSGFTYYVPVNEGDHVVASVSADNQVLDSLDTTVDCVPAGPPETIPLGTPQLPPPSGGGLPETGDNGTVPMSLLGAGLGAVGLGLVGVGSRRRWVRR